MDQSGTSLARLGEDWFYFGQYHVIMLVILTVILHGGQSEIMTWEKAKGGMSSDYAGMQTWATYSSHVAVALFIPCALQIEVG